MVCKTGGYVGSKLFEAGRGVTQGGALSHWMFNIMVGAVIRERLCFGVGIAPAATGLGRRVEEFLTEFDADDGIIVNWCPELIQQLSLD